jgi:hypothetical protein
VKIPNRFTFAAVTGPTPWNLSTVSTSTKAGPIAGVMTKSPWLSVVHRRNRRGAIVLAVMAHEAFDAAPACRMPVGAQGRMDSRRAIAPAMSHMEPPDLDQQDAMRYARSILDTLGHILEMSIAE